MKCGHLFLGALKIIVQCSLKLFSVDWNWHKTREGKSDLAMARSCCTSSFPPWLVPWGLPRSEAGKERWISAVILPQQLHSAVGFFSAIDVLNVNFFPGVVLWFFSKMTSNTGYFLLRVPLPDDHFQLPLSCDPTEIKYNSLLLDLQELI